MAGSSGKAKGKGNDKGFGKLKAGSRLWSTPSNLSQLSLLQNLFNAGNAGWKISSIFRSSASASEICHCCCCVIDCCLIFFWHAEPAHMDRNTAWGQPSAPQQRALKMR